jgi:hypothetical protein
MIAAHFENLLFLLLIAVALLFQFLSRAASKASRDQTGRTSRSSTPETPPSIPRAPVESDEERIRRFLEALGQPAGSRPPPPVMPRTTIPPRPLAPIQPPSIPTARNILTGRKRQVVEARKPAPPPVFEVHEAAAPLDAPQRPIATPAAVYAMATGPDLVRYEDKIDIVTLLRSQAGLRNAIMLREIFGPPRSLQPLDLRQVV